MKIVVIGADGQLGSDLCRVLEGKNLVPLIHREIEVANFEGVREALTEHGPDVVINTAAYHLVDRCEDHVREAFEVNAYGARNLALICRELDIPLVHLSTDYVFDGRKRIPYREEDVPCPLSAYATSKLAGEYFIRALLPRHFIIRSCGLYGIEGAKDRRNNFVETMLRLAREEKEIRVVDDQIVTPTSTWDLARKIVELIRTDSYGLYHITNGGECSWYGFARTIFQQAGLRPDLRPTTSEAFGARARRPAYSVLENRRLRRLGMDDVRDWREALAAYLEERKRILNYEL